MITLTILITGGAGFIGSNLVKFALARGYDVVTLDKLTYAGNLSSLAPALSDPRHRFAQGDIADAEFVRGLLAECRPAAVINLAAESHVDRSIDGPRDFIETNIVGTFCLLDESRRYYEGLSDEEKSRFRFFQISTDEVYGSLGREGHFTEETHYSPNSPYSASKASADHLVRAWHHTYGLPVLITNCSNNYGPYQFPEKLIPHMVLSALGGRRLPVYGDGSNVRDWLYVGDHCSAIMTALERGRVGETYVVGGHSERTNLQIVHLICDALDELRPKAGGGSYREQIEFVTDRPGHDFRYAIDPAKLREELGWSPSVKFEDGIMETIKWYLDNGEWTDRILSGEYRLARIGKGDAR